MLLDAISTLARLARSLTVRAQREYNAPSLACASASAAKGHLFGFPTYDRRHEFGAFKVRSERDSGRSDHRIVAQMPACRKIKIPAKTASIAVSRRAHTVPLGRKGLRAVGVIRPRHAWLRVDRHVRSWSGLAAVWRRRYAEQG